MENKSPFRISLPNNPQFPSKCALHPGIRRRIRKLPRSDIPNITNLPTWPISNRIPILRRIILRTLKHGQPLRGAVAAEAVTEIIAHGRTATSIAQERVSIAGDGGLATDAAVVGRGVGGADETGDVADIGDAVCAVSAVNDVVGGAGGVEGGGGGDDGDNRGGARGDGGCGRGRGCGEGDCC